MRYPDLVHLLLPWAEHWSFGLVAAHEHWSFGFGLVALVANRCSSPAMLVANAIRPIPHAPSADLSHHSMKLGCATFGATHALQLASQNAA